VASHTQTTLGIDWQAATDAGGIETYQVYVNGALDGTSAVTPYVIDGLSCGTTYTVGVEAVDFAENHSPRTTAQLSTDACAAPTGATIDVSAKLSKPTKLAVSWSADNADTVASWDVRQQTAPWNGGLGAATTWLSATQLTAKSYDPGQGKTVCFSVRARDAAGHTSAWSTPDCESTPLDDRALTPVGAWQKLSDSSHFAGTALQTQTAGDSLTLTGVHARGFSLIADRGPTAGTLRVEWNGTVMGTVKLKAARAKPAWVELLIQLGTPQTGTLKLTATTTGKPVTIDALNVFGD
jgi:hypothetical protein